jgi:hypothetical protein
MWPARAAYGGDELNSATIGSAHTCQWAFRPVTYRYHTVAARLRTPRV